MKGLVTIILMMAVLVTPNGKQHVEECFDIYRTADHTTVAVEGWDLRECFIAFL